MHKANSLLMQAPKMAIFETAANLELWPEILPHYRYIRFLERGTDRNVVVMAAERSGIPISWTSEQIIDRSRLEIHFHHLKAWTKGMRVVWTFSDTSDGVLVTISHDLRFSIPVLTPIVHPIIGDFFIHDIANKTLRCMKAYLEARANKVTALARIRQRLRRGRHGDARSLLVSAPLHASGAESMRFGTESWRKEAVLPASQALIQPFSACAAPVRFAIGIRKVFFRPIV